MILFACLYELHLNNMFYGKIIRFCNCKIVEILYSHFNCNQIFLKKERMCPCCIVKQIIGVYSELSVVIDDGSAQCVLDKEFNDVISLLNLSKIQHVWLIHRLKDIGFVNVKFEEDVNIIDTINTHRLCDNLREYGIKQGGIKSIIG
eukprot:421555_1